MFADIPRSRREEGKRADYPRGILQAEEPRTSGQKTAATKHVRFLSPAVSFDSPHGICSTPEPMVVDNDAVDSLAKVFNLLHPVDEANLPSPTRSESESQSDDYFNLKGPRSSDVDHTINTILRQLNPVGHQVWNHNQTGGWNEASIPLDAHLEPASTGPSRRPQEALSSASPFLSPSGYHPLNGRQDVSPSSKLILEPVKVSHTDKKQKGNPYPRARAPLDDHVDPITICPTTTTSPSNFYKSHLPPAVPPQPPAPNPSSSKIQNPKPLPHRPLIQSPDMPPCQSLTCPVRALPEFANGLELHTMGIYPTKKPSAKKTIDDKNEVNARREPDIFGDSNPPWIVWNALDRIKAGTGKEIDGTVVEEFVRCHYWVRRVSSLEDDKMMAEKKERIISRLRRSYGKGRDV